MVIPVKIASEMPKGTWSPKRPLSYLEFLQTCKVIRMLYGRDLAEEYLTNNWHVYYNKDNA